MKISLIAAIGLNYELGENNHLPWKYIKSDMDRFKELTKGHCIIMGRKCHESIGKVLPDRKNIIVSSKQEYKVRDCIVRQTLQLAMDYALSTNETEVFIIGGASIYNQMINTGCVDTIYLTVVQDTFPNADVFFPKLDSDMWEKTKVNSIRNNKDDAHNVDFYILKNKKFL